MSMTAPTVQELGIIAAAVQRPQWEAVAPNVAPQPRESRLHLGPDCELHFRVGRTEKQSYQDAQTFAGISLNSMSTCCHYFGNDAAEQRENLMRQLRDKLAGIVAAIDDVIGEETPC